MAIFAGTWLDGSGIPFDAEAKVPHTWTGGGSAAVRRHAIRPHSQHAPFVRTARYMADRWRNVLAQRDRDDWTYQGPTGPTRRGNLARTATNGYVMFNAFDFVQLWADPPSSILQPAVLPPWTWTALSLDSVNVGAQTLTFTATADAPPVFAAVRFATFQINPRAVRHANPWRATRLLDLAVAADFDPGPYNPTVPLAWPVATGDLVRIYTRGRVGSWWKYEADDALTA